MSRNRVDLAVLDTHLNYAEAFRARLGQTIKTKIY